MAKDARRWLDVRLLLRGYLIIALGLAAVAVWLALAGPPPRPALAQVTVPVEIVTPPPEAQLPPANMPADTPSTLPVPPKPGADGMDSARPFDQSDKRPRIAILVTELGQSRDAGQAAIHALPPQVSLAFLPFPDETEAMAGEAKAAGHEVLLDIPMEPSNYPDDDPGPDALMTTASDGENTRRLNWDLARAHGYVGVVNFMGARFTAAQEKLAPLFAALRARDLLIADTRANALTAVPAMAEQARVPYALADLTIDAEASRDSVDASLAQLEVLARKNGKAFGVAGTYPVTFERLAQWAKSLDAKGIALAPVSAVVTMPKR